MKFSARIKETFTAPQGEGHLSGKIMRFIRFAGCDVASCALHPINLNLCDTDWRKGEKRLIDDLIQKAKDACVKWICITGGEPTSQPIALEQLCIAAERAEIKVQLQTSGIRPVQARTDWLTVSPKCMPHEIQCQWGHELKVVNAPLVHNGKFVDLDFGLLRAFYEQTKFATYYLQPLYKPDGSMNINETIEMVRGCQRAGMEWELSLQTQHLANFR